MVFTTILYTCFEHVNILTVLVSRITQNHSTGLSHCPGVDVSLTRNFWFSIHLKSHMTELCPPAELEELCQLWVKVTALLSCDNNNTELNLAPDPPVQPTAE